MHVNPSALRLFGTKRAKDLVGKSVFNFIHKDYHAILQERIKKNAEMEKLPHIDVKLVQIDGKVIDVQCFSTPWIYRGKPAVQVFARDVSDRKALDVRLRRKKELIDCIIQSSMDGIVAFDCDLRYTLRSPSMEKITGVPNKEFLGKKILDMYPSFQETGEDKPLYEALEGKTVVVKDKIYCIPQTGKSGYYEACYGPLRGEKNDVIGGLIIIRDVTEHKRSEKTIEEKNIALKELLNQMEIEKKDSKANAAASIQKRILPIVRELYKKSKTDQKELISFLEKDLEELTESFGVGAERKMIKLSRKETVICEMIRKGLSNKEVAKALKVSPLTVGTHRNHIRKKLGLSHGDNLSSALL